MAQRLDLDKAVADELDRLEQQEKAIEATVSTEGVEAEVTYTWRNGWGLAAYVRSKWEKPKPEAGARVRKTF